MECPKCGKVFEVGDQVLPYIAHLLEHLVGLREVKPQEITLPSEVEVKDESESINDMGFSPRVVNCLFRENIFTRAMLESTPDKVLLSFKNFGNQSLLEVKAILNGKEKPLPNTYEHPYVYKIHLRSDKKDRWGYGYARCGAMITQATRIGEIPTCKHCIKLQEYDLSLPS